MILNSGGDTESALSSALDSIADRPVAALSNGTYQAAAGRAIHFDASGSAAVDGTIAEYRWDLDGDGFTDETTTEPTVNHTYPAGHAGVMQVLVVDQLGRSANASAGVLVEPEPVRGLVARVPSATGMVADAAASGDHVDLRVGWTPGADRPERWVVAVDGDPVGVVSGDHEELTVAVPFQDEPWTVSVTPMSAGGDLGPAYDAQLQAISAPPAWYARPAVWGAAVGAGLLGFAGMLLALRRLLRRGTAEARG